MAASALARHLSDSGVQFLPIANAAQVAQISSELQSKNEVSANEDEVETHTLDAAVDTAEHRAVRSSEPRHTPPLISENTAEAYSLPVLPLDQRKSRLFALKEIVAACTRCPQLTQSRINTVFGEGNPSARVAFFGEGPGADEDRSGRPFVGRAGQLLTKMIEACTFAREDVYIFNTVKCRPPGNRNPEPTELANCREYFEQQLAVIQPEYIVCLGAVSAQTLLETTRSVGQLRGRWHAYNASKVLVTYHPAYLLRNPAAKKAAWDDLKMMLSDMGIRGLKRLAAHF